VCILSCFAFLASFAGGVARRFQPLASPTLSTCVLRDYSRQVDTCLPRGSAGRLLLLALQRTILYLSKDLQKTAGGVLAIVLMANMYQPLREDLLS
jgi:hypothetical protein